MSDFFYNQIKTIRLLWKEEMTGIRTHENTEHDAANQSLPSDNDIPFTAPGSLVETTSPTTNEEHDTACQLLHDDTDAQFTYLCDPEESTPEGQLNWKDTAFDPEHDATTQSLHCGTETALIDPADLDDSTPEHELDYKDHGSAESRGDCREYRAANDRLSTEAQNETYQQAYAAAQEGETMKTMNLNKAQVEEEAKVMIGMAGMTMAKDWLLSHSANPSQTSRRRCCLIVMDDLLSNRRF